MTLRLNGDLPPDLPELALNLRPIPPDAWTGIVLRARRRRRRVVALGAAAAVLAAGVPALALTARTKPVELPAHQPAASFDGICDTAFDQPAPSGDVLTHSFRLGSFVFSPPGANTPKVAAAEIRRRATARGLRPEPGAQLRYALVRSLHDSQPAKTQLRWVLTTCGEPVQPMPPLRGRPTPPEPITQSRIYLLTDTGAVTEELPAAGFGGVCDGRLDQPAPAGDRVRFGFYVGESVVFPPPTSQSLPGRAAVARALAADKLTTFPGSQIRLGMVRPLHTAGTPALRWVVTTCSLDGRSVRPALPGAVNELLIFDSSGRLLRTERSGPQSEAERLIATFPPVPTPAPTYQAASPNMCGPWSHAYPDFRQKARAAGYTGGMQGCYLQAGAVVIFISAPHGHAAAAYYRAPTETAYNATYKAGFHWDRFTLVPAPFGTTVRLLRLLSPHVAEVELSEPGQAPVDMKFDAATARFLPCSDTASTAAPCQG